MPAFSDADFSGCMFIGAGGADLQSVLRLSHLLPQRPLGGAEDAVRGCVVLNATYERGLDARGVQDALLRQVAAVNEFYGRALLNVIGAPEPVRREDFNLASVAPPPPGVLDGSWAQRDYMGVFGQQGGADPSVFGIELRLALRMGEHMLHVRYVFIAAEALATLWALSRGGCLAPRILVTIQSGPLEQRDGPMEALLAALRPPLPTVWVRGQHLEYPPRYNLERVVRAEAAIADPSLTYPVRLGRFAGWRSDLGAEPLFHRPSDRDATKVAAFAFATAPPPPAVVWQRASDDGQRVLRLVPWASSPDDAPPLFVGSARAVRAGTEHGWVSTTWGELGAGSRAAPTHLGLLDGMRLAEQAARERGLTDVAMTPCGLEWEAEAAIEAWLAEPTRPMRLTIYYKSPLDFVVVRGAWRDGAWRTGDGA